MKNKNRKTFLRTVKEILIEFLAASFDGGVVGPIGCGLWFLFLGGLLIYSTFHDPEVEGWILGGILLVLGVIWVVVRIFHIQREESNKEDS